MLSRILTVLFISGLFSSVGYTAIYKWVDDEGKVHYSQQKPREHESKKVPVSTQVPKNTSTYKRPSLKNDEDKATEGDKDKSGQADGQSAPAMSGKEKQQACDRARKALTALTSSGRVRQRDKDGNVTYMTEEQQQQRIEREKERIKTLCQ